MNETLSVIKNRRSIRSFKRDAVTDEQISQILEAGLYAPSAMNEQPWHFTVITNQDTMKRLSKASAEIFINSGNEALKKRLGGRTPEEVDLFYHAPVVIVVSGEANTIAPQIDCALAIENMFLAAESLRIGSCWIHALGHVCALPEGQKMLTEEGIVPPGNIVVGTAVFGYRTEAAIAPPRKENTVSYID